MAWAVVICPDKCVIYKGTEDLLQLEQFRAAQLAQPVQADVRPFIVCQLRWQLLLSYR